MGSIGFSNISRSLHGPVKTSDPLYDGLTKIHKKFDARKHWRHCKTIGAVRDQGNCGCCWVSTLNYYSTNSYIKINTFSK